MLPVGKLALLSLTAILGFSQVCFAQSYPDCAVGCIGTADPGPCSLDDNACLCSYAPFVEGTYACFKSSCPDANDVKSAYELAAAYCNAAGVTSTIVAPPKRTLIPMRRTYPIVVKRA